MEWNVISHPKRRKQIMGVREQDVEYAVWT
jgi:hypothetical protein